MPAGEVSREYVRLTVIFRRESEDWKVVYIAVSIPDQLVRDGEVYPITGLVEQNQVLQRLLDERTLELSAANEKLKALTPTKDRVRQCLESRCVEDSDMPSIAQALNLSTRTLVRRLRAEGTSFLEIKDQLRRDTTLRLLQETNRSVEDIALQVGFESLTAFHRAFKAWTGSTPMAYRRKAESDKCDRPAVDD
jgi:AraC-like DNA-binding protein